MKNINQYIFEKLRINKSKLKVGTEHTLFPKSRPELIDMIIKETKKNGNNCSLNHILFSFSSYSIVKIKC